MYDLSSEVIAKIIAILVVGLPIEVGGTWAAKNEYLLRTKMAESHR